MMVVVEPSEDDLDNRVSSSPHLAAVLPPHALRPKLARPSSKIGPGRKQTLKVQI